MADIQLSRPAANQTQIVPSAADARFVLDFATGDAKLAKSENGENLVLTFDDGAKIEVEGFYTTFNKDSLPTLNVGGQDISGEQLAAVLGEDLMPAAGPASAAQAAPQGGRFRSFADADLNGGLDRLNGLDIGFDGAARQDDGPEGYYALADGAVAAPEEAGPEPAPVPPTPMPPTPAPVLLPPEAVDDTIIQPIMGSRVYDLLGNDVRAAAFAEFRDADGNPLTPDGAGVYTLQYGTFVINADKHLVYTPDAAKIQAAYDAMVAASEAGTGPTPTFVQEEHLSYSVKSAEGLESNFATVTLAPGVTTGSLVGDAAGEVAWSGNVDKGGELASGGGDDVLFADYNRGRIVSGDGADTINVRLNTGVGTIDSGEGADVINVGYKLPTTESYYGNSGTINAGGGDDTIHIGVYGRARGGNGGTINGGEGNDHFDVAHAGATSVLNGDVGNDYFFIDGHHGIINGGTGNDTVYGWLNTGAVNGGDGDDTFTLGNNTGTVDGGAGKDVITVATNTKAIFGGDDGDSITVTDHSGTIDGGAGADTISVQGNHGLIKGGDGDDEITVTNGAGTVQGNAGNESFTVKGGSGKFEGNEGEDSFVIEGGKKARFDGGADTDHFTVNGGTGSTVLGGAGTDVIEVYAGTDYVINGGADKDTLVVAGGSGNTIDGGTEGDTFIVAANADNGWDGGTGNTLKGGAGDDYFQVQAGTGNTYEGNDDNDTFVVGNAAATGNTFDGGAGNDIFRVSNINVHGNTLDGGTGTDTFTVYGYEHTMDGGDDNDTFTVYGHHNVAAGGEGDDHFTAGGHHNTFDGGEGDDVFNVYSANANTVSGGAGADTFNIQGNGNSYDGGEGNDAFHIGSSQSNTFAGGAGNDLFDAVVDASGYAALRSHSNNAFDGGDNLDLLLTPWLTEGDVSKGLAELTTVENMDAIVIKGAAQFSGRSQGEVRDALGKMGVEWGDNADKFVFEGSQGWTEGETHTINTTEYTRMDHGDDMSILVATSSLQFNS